MKLEVNGTIYDIEIMQNKVKVNSDKELDLITNLDEEKNIKIIVFPQFSSPIDYYATLITSQRRRITSCS